MMKYEKGPTKMSKGLAKLGMKTMPKMKSVMPKKRVTDVWWK